MRAGRVEDKQPRGAARRGQSDTPGGAPRRLSQAHVPGSSCSPTTVPHGSPFSRHFSDEEPGGSVTHPGPPEPSPDPFCHLSLSPKMFYCEEKDQALGLKPMP